MEKAHVFVADDDKPFLEIVRRVLEDEGYRATLLHVRDNAYKEIEEARPDLVILDVKIQLSAIAWALFDRLKLEPATANIPVIISCADLRSLRERQEYLRELGCPVLIKPFELNDLIAAVNAKLTNLS